MQPTLDRPRLSLSSPRRLRGLQCQALFGKKARSKEETDKQPRKGQDGQNWFSRQIDALDFAQTRSEGDRQSIDKAKLRLSGKLKAGKGEDQGKMSREEYAALRRKVGGTAKDYWKDFIQADEVESVKSSGLSSSVQGVPILLAVLAGLVVVTGVVVSQTSGQDPANSPEQASAAQATLVASQ